MQRLLDTRLTRQQTDYAARIPRSLTLEKKLQQLARCEPRKATWRRSGREGKGVFVLHREPLPDLRGRDRLPGLLLRPSSICSGRCSGPGVTVERTEHIVGGDRRCAYRVEAADTA